MDASTTWSVIERFSEYFSHRREEITRQWLIAVQSDPRLKTADKLSLSQLRDHLPALYDNLIEVIRDPFDKDGTGNINKDARKHGKHRFGQGYHLKELIRELSRIRSVITSHMILFQEQEPSIETSVKILLFLRLDAFFDKIISDSVEQFVQEQQSELKNEAADAKKQTLSTKSLNVQLQKVDSARLSLLRNIVHELGNSFYGIQLSVQSFPIGNDKEEYHSSMYALDQQMTYMSELLSELLDFSIILDENNLPLKLETISARYICDTLSSIYGPRAKAKKLQLKAECDPNLDTVVTDRVKIFQIAGNLLANAIKYTETGLIHFWLRQLGEHRWSLGVSDTGPGIPEEEQGDIFKEFHRGKHTLHLHGTGLGLAIVSRLTQLFGGQVSMKTTSENGSTFEIILPLNPVSPK